MCRPTEFTVVGPQPEKLDEKEWAQFVPGEGAQLGNGDEQILSWPYYGLSPEAYGTGSPNAASGLWGSPGVSIRSSSLSNGGSTRTPPPARPLARRAPRWPPPVIPLPSEPVHSTARSCASSVPGGAPRTTCRWTRSI